MSVSFSWRPLSEKANFFENGVSADEAAMSNTFGPTPWKLGESHVKILTAMHWAKGCGDSLFADIVSVINKVGTIEVWPEY